MKKIAVLADIHGNVPAMEATLADLREQNPDEVLVGGDLVGRGPEGSKVARRMREMGWRGVRGNHEDYMLGFRRAKVPVKWLHDDEWAASRWMAAELTDQDVDYLDALPFSIASDLAPDLCLVHGSPRSHVEGLGPWSTDGQLNHHLQRIDGRLLVCAHTHRPMYRELAEGIVVNVGAVGLPFNGDRRAQYAIFHGDAGDWKVEFRQVDYETDRIFEIYESSGFLREGGVTARLLWMELEHAAPFLVPFTKWAAAQGLPAEPSRIEAFLEFYDPREPMRTFLRKLDELG